METEALRLFVEVTRRGSFAAVARDRRIDPSLVSRAVASLEHDLGVRLLQRTTRRLALTEAGERYLGRIEPLVDELDRAREAVLVLSTGPIGTLRLTASVAFGQRCLVPLLPQLRSSFPQLRLELLLTDAKLDLVGERIDLAIRLGPAVPGDGVRVKWFDTHYRVCASPAYLQRAHSLRDPAELPAHRCLLFALPEFRSQWRFRDAEGIVSEVPVDGDIVISNALALRECTLAGMGPALLAHWLIDEDIAQGRLVDLFPAYRASATDFETAAWLIYPSWTFLPYKVRVVVDFLKQYLAELQPRLE
ncbi:LysR family transcriptional regulator [Gloeobacter violaceus]|uniref:LysR family transcriptional regulatory protein n=1 Tax=Gloeobacter violaceus (strain ATCC 29082 / PCC 7421) TaxID=251221 RepID=Q7NEX0_GLOVI|nr:LysR family transcriptional regulator [Gloeobacter violaceus]BAC91699.1 LysR family transcriptional regulatory protein [Gloeobacter violaceus PCC 7421]